MHAPRLHLRRRLLRLRTLSLATLAATVATLVLGPAPADALSGSSISWLLAAPTVTRGSTDTLNGAVTMGSTARPVLLQRYASGAWRATATSVRTATGRFALPLPTTATGRFTYRAFAPTAGGRVAVATRAVVVTVTLPPVSNPRAYGFLSRVANPSAPVARWDPCTSTGGRRTIGYAVNPANAPAGYAADVAGAFSRLGAATGLVFVRRADTAIVPGAKGQRPYPADVQIVLAWAAPGVSAYLPAGTGELARGGATWQLGYRDVHNGPASSIVAGYVVLDPGRHLAGGFGAGPVYGLQGTEGQLLMHELGHAVGLAHPAIRDVTEVMSPVLTRKLAVWGAGDRTGLRLVGATAGCLHRG